MVNKTGIAGCCAASNFYNLGGAHGYVTAKNQEEFDKQTIDRYSFSSVNIAICNYQQVTTMSYLETQGWRKEKVGSLWVFTISYNEIMAYKAKRKLKARKEKKISLSEKMDFYLFCQFRSNSPLLKTEKEELENIYGVKIPDRFLGSLNKTVLFNSIKTLRSIARKKAKNSESSEFKAA